MSLLILFRHSESLKPISSYTTKDFYQPPRRKLVASVTSQSYLERASLHISASKPISINCLILSSYVISLAKFSVHVFAVYSNILRSYLYIFATSASQGSSGSGAQSRACSEIRAVRMVKAGVHSFFRMSKQIAPVWELMLGCQILVMNLIYNRVDVISIVFLLSHSSVRK